MLIWVRSGKTVEFNADLVGWVGWEVETIRDLLVAAL